MGEPVVMNSASEAVHQAMVVAAGPRDDAERRAIALAQQFFPGPVHMEDTFDPEDPTWQRRVIVVTATGNPKEMVRREMECDARLISELGAAADNLVLRLNFSTEAP